MDTAHTPNPATVAQPPDALGLDRWVGLVGPTASGKSGVALRVASHVDLEIISVDSALVYRGMDIGTAKPTARERAQVPHHLIDIIEPTQRYSAALFSGHARRLIREINARGRLPLLVGGTMLYLKALMDGLDAMPGADPLLSQTLLAEGQARGWPALHEELRQVDPPTAARLHPQDAQRIHRALQVWRQTGKPLSSFHSKDEAERDGLAPRLLISLEPAQRSWLHERIALRMECMLQSGLTEEVAALRARPELHRDLPSMRSVGYRQAWAAMDAGLAGQGLRETILRTGAAATRQLAKRQMTWLRSIPNRVSLDAQDPASAQAVTALVRQHAQG